MAKNNKKIEKIKIDPNIGITTLVERYPIVVDILQNDYEFHCVNCMFSEFDTLENGALLHGIEGEDFTELIDHLEEIINSDSSI
ncbi:MAG: DUF1858 domain-containing protein [Candidatus Dojkabacteria bacterium]